MNRPVLITVPKYVAISPLPLKGGRQSPEIVVCDEVDAIVNDTGRPKKRRLDNLSWEEKIQRKKLKNRVAAQTSRDRKKAKMEEMEQTIDELSERTEILQNKCDSLQAINESLLEKNQKLDCQVIDLQRQLNELQAQQQSSKTTNCVSCESNLKGSAEGNGLTVDTTLRQRPEQTLRRQNSNSSLEDCGAMPSLQDLLEDFDATKLEELAESLLADITQHMEASDCEGHANVAQDQSRAERLPGSVVGTTPEIVESSQHTTGSPSDFIKSEKETNEQTIESAVDTMADSDTVYGTYDEKTNSITILMADDTIPLDEAVQEVCSEGESMPVDEEQIKLEFKEAEEMEDDFDPIKEFLCPKNPSFYSRETKSPLSIHSSLSDHGYESVGSPAQSEPDLTKDSPFSFDVDFPWNSSFPELFPSLL